MDDSAANAAPWANAAAVASLGEDLMKLRLRAADATLGSMPSKKVLAVPMGTARTVAVGLSHYGPPAAVMIGVFGFTLLLGIHLLSPVGTVVRQESGHSADTSQGAQKMADELAAHKTDDPARRALQSPSPKVAASLGDTAPRLDAAKIQVNAATGEVPVKVEPSPRQPPDEPSKVSERFDGIGHKIAALSSAAPIADRPVSAAPIPRKRSHVARGDAFDPSRNSKAPGAPRPLGTTAPSRPLNN
jgi:hypothetical protein